MTTTLYWKQADKLVCVYAGSIERTPKDIKTLSPEADISMPATIQLSQAGMEIFGTTTLPMAGEIHHFAERPNGDVDKVLVGYTSTYHDPDRETVGVFLTEAGLAHVNEHRHFDGKVEVVGPSEFVEAVRNMAPIGPALPPPTAIAA